MDCHAIGAPTCPTYVHPVEGSIPLRFFRCLDPAPHRAATARKNWVKIRPMPTGLAHKPPGKGTFIQNNALREASDLDPPVRAAFESALGRTLRDEESRGCRLSQNCPTTPRVDPIRDEL